MAQAAKNTERHAMAWGTVKLREQSITFVSAGHLHQDEIKATGEEDGDKDVKEDIEPTPAESTLLSQLAKSSEQSASDSEQPLVRADSPAEAVAQTPAPRRDSISSQSSDEILFAGRGNPIPRMAAKITPATSKPPTPSPEKRTEEAKLPFQNPLATPEITAQDSSSSGLERFNNILPSQHRQGADRRGRARQRRKDDEEDLINDYIANMTFDDDSDDNVADIARSVKTGRRTEHFRFFDGATESKVSVQPEPSSKAAKKTTKVEQAIDWDSADLEDFDEFSTTDEEVIEVSQVLRFRTRPSGRQYLVNPLDKDASEPRWVLHDKLISKSAVEEIRIFEEIQTMKIQQTPESEDSESDSEAEEADDDLMDDIDSEDAENERILKHTSRMTDEQIARALAKQEELGLGSDELLLLDGNVDDYDDDEDVDEHEDEFATGDAFIPFSAKKHLSSRTTSRRNRRQRDHFPSASAFADALDQDPYGAFDIMDFERPSLRPKKKGRKSDLPFELGIEDPELAQRLRSTWEKDREKKTARKREKQLEREDALLDAAERNQPAAIRAEIRQFMAQEVDTLELAPMDAGQRAAMHRLAKALKLVSKSHGKDGHGIGRYAVLTKGPHTPRFTIDTIWEIDALLESRKFFPKGVFGSFRTSAGPKTRTPGLARARRGGGGTMSGATYMNGDVVGASAPEIGAGNKGRAMLEKMGWQVGMGIGAVGNKGSIEVIKHVVKTTKAGLG
ncbi:R3H and G-patch domain-containing protein [Cladophialophora carrionii]|uniref:R3H and G-patch domain-containing protein n=1 Tax=Cladophialophora carrionii TaxID=86049 RepID=A0A1C1CGS4_9EURO|nr:R3H and G-patch domain-containing protein [Cladophialophora carrionii]